MESEGIWRSHEVKEISLLNYPNRLNNRNMKRRSMCPRISGILLSESINESDSGAGGFDGVFCLGYQSPRNEHGNLHICRSTDDSSYFYPYRISYMWYSPIGFVTSTIIGYAASYVLRFFFKEESIEMDPDLLVPFLASRLRRKRELETREHSGN